MLYLFACYLLIKTNRLQTHVDLNSNDPSNFKLASLSSFLGGHTDIIGQILNAVFGQLLQHISAHPHMLLYSLRSIETTGNSVIEIFDVNALYTNVLLLAEHMGTTNLYGFSASQLLSFPLIRQLFRAN